MPNGLMFTYIILFGLNCVKIWFQGMAKVVASFMPIMKLSCTIVVIYYYH